MNLKLGDTALLIKTAQKNQLLRNQLAYLLATVYHETAHTMLPIVERGGQKYLKSKKYWPYIGRGYVQLTWDYNYEKAGKLLKANFLSNPDLLLEKKYAAPIAVMGMKEGWFTGKKLSDYITLAKSDFHKARRIINGLDDAALIASYARTYDILLKNEGYGEERNVNV
jgi:predicted chitinase